MPKFLWFVIGLLLLVIIPTPTNAQDIEFIYVTTTADTLDVNYSDGICADDSNRCSLRAAIITSGRLSGVQTIVLPAGVFTLEYNLFEIGHSVSLIGTGSDKTIINANNHYGIRYYYPSGYNNDPLVSEISSLAIKNARMSGISLYSYGEYTIRDVLLSRNEVGIEGRGNQLELTVVNSTISNNLHSGIEFLGTQLTVDNTVIRDNGNEDTFGGGINVTGEFNLTRSAIINNTAVVGGGILILGGSYSNHRTTEISNTTISGNTAFNTGGIYAESYTDLNLNNVTITNNFATVENPGGIRSFSSSPVTLSNSIIYGNVSYQGIAFDIRAGLNSLGNNILGEMTNPVSPAPTDIVGINPLLTPLSWDYPQPVHRLVDGSPAYNAGNITLCETTDQIGVTRNGACDIGAVEMPSATDAEIALTLTADDTVLDAGQNAVVTARVTNNGPESAQNIQVAVDIPDELTLQDVSQPNFANGLWTIDTLASGQTTELMLDVLPPSGGAEYPISIEYSEPTTFDPLLFNNRADLALLVEPTNLILHTALSTDTFTLNAPFTFTVSATNTGTFVATNAEINIVLPEGIQITSSDAIGLSGTTWTIDTLPIGETHTVTLQLSAIRGAVTSGVHEFSAHLMTLDQYDLYPGDDAMTRVASIANTDVGISMQTDVTHLFPGQEFTLDFEVFNLGSTSVSLLPIELLLPDDVSVIAYDSSAIILQDDMFILRLPLYTPPSTVNRHEFSLTLRVAETAIAPSTSTFRATLKSPYVDNATFNDVAELTQNIALPMDLSLHQDTAVHAQPGETLTYTLTLFNQTAYEATNIIVRADLDQVDLTYNSHSGDGTFNPITEQWQIASLAPFSQATLQVVTTVNSTPGPIVTTAEIYAFSQPDIDSTPNNLNVNEDDFARNTTRICSNTTQPVYEISDGDVNALISALNAIRSAPCYNGEAVINLATEGEYTLTRTSGSDNTLLPTVEHHVRINGNGSTISLDFSRAFEVGSQGELALENMVIHAQFSGLPTIGGTIYNRGNLVMRDVRLTGYLTSQDTETASAIYSNNNLYMDRVEANISGNSDASFIHHAGGEAIVINSVIHHVNRYDSYGRSPLLYVTSDHQPLSVVNTLLSAHSGNRIFDGTGMVNLRGSIIDSTHEMTSCVIDGAVHSDGYNIFNNFSECDGSFLTTTDITTDSLFVVTPMDLYNAMYLPIGDYAVRVLSQPSVIDQIPAEFCPAGDHLGNARPINGTGAGASACDIGPYEYAVEPDLDVSVVVDNTTPQVNDIINLTVTATNNSAVTRRNVSVGIHVPENTTLQFTDIPDFQWNRLVFFSIQDVVWIVPHDLAPGTSAQITLPVRIQGDIADGIATASAFTYAEPQAQPTASTIDLTLECETDVDWTVADGDAQGLVLAIEMANNETCHPGLDTITIDGVVSLTEPYYYEDNSYNLLPIITSEITVLGGEIRRYSRGSARLFEVAENGALTLNGVTLNGTQQASAVEQYLSGGAVYNAGSLTVIDSAIINNSTQYGAAVYNIGNVVISNTLISNNFTDNYRNSDHYGSIIYNLHGSVLIEGSTFDSNHMRDRSGSNGGAIIANVVPSQMTIRNSRFSNNQLGDQGVVVSNYDTDASTSVTDLALTIEDSLFIQNSGNSLSSVVTIYDAGLVVERSAFVLNNITSITAIDTITINNSLFSGNTGSGVISLGQFTTPDRSITISNTTISQNTGSMIYGSYSNNTPLTIRNNIFDGSSFSCGNFDTHSEGHNISNIDNCAFDHPTDVENVETGLGALQFVNNAPLVALLPGSPALDVVSACDANVDLRGLARPANGNCDAGAFEMQSQIISTNLALSAEYSTTAPVVDEVIVTTLTVTNEGANTANNVEISFYSPFTFQSASGDGTTSENLWTLSSVPAGESRTIAISHLAENGYGDDDLHFRARLLSLTESDTNHADNSVESEVLITNFADVSISSIYVRQLTDDYASETTTISEMAEYSADIYVSRSSGITPIDTIVNLSLPDGIEYISHSTDFGAYENDVWTIPDMGSTSYPNRPRLTVNFRLIPGTPPQTIDWIANVTSEWFDPYMENNRFVETLQIVDAVDVVLTITPQPTIAFVGEEAQFMVTVTNNSLVTVTNLDVSLGAFPPATSITTSEPYAYPVWQIPEIPAGESRTLILSTTITAELDRRLFELWAETENVIGDYDQSNNTAESYIAINPSDLSIEVNTTNPTPNAGDEVTFTFTVTNNSSMEVPGVNLSVYTPSGLTNVTNSGDFTPGIYDFSAGTLAAGATATQTFTATVRSNQVGRIIWVEGRVYAEDSLSESDYNNNSVYFNFAVNGATLDLEFAPLAQPEYSIDDQVEITLNLTNQGPLAVEEAEVAINLPGGFTLSNSSAPIVNNRWTVTDLDVNETISLALTLDIDLQAAGYRRSVEARVMSSEPDTPSNQTVRQTIDVIGTDGRLSFIRTPSSNEPQVYETGDKFEVQVRATGSSRQIEDVVIALEIPDGITPISYDEGFDPQTNTITGVATNGSLYVNMTFEVTEPVGGQEITLAGTLETPGLPDRVPSNNTATLTNYVRWMSPQAITVTTTADDGDGRCTVDACTLREALSDAMVADGSTITVPEGTYLLNGSFIPIRNNITVIGDGEVVIDANLLSGIFYIYSDYTVTLQNLILQNGYARLNHANYGGAIYNAGALTVTDSVIRNSRAVYGGGIYVESNTASITILRSEIYGNTASSYGGGLYQSSSTEGTIEQSTFAENNARYGAGLFSSGSLTINHSTISGNVATESAGGIYSSSTMTINYSTITANRANHTSSSTTGGIYETSNYGHVTLAHTIVSGNSVPSISYNSDINTATSSGYNWIGYLASVYSLSGISETDVYNADPLLLPLADNGGPSRTHLLQGNSTAINRIPVCSGIDQRGVARPTDGRCDMGAVELNLDEITLPPFVTEAYLITGNSSEVLTPGRIFTSTPQFEILFNRDMLNSNELAQYQLVELGADGILQTNSCATVANDDVNYPLQSLSGSTDSALLTLPTLPDGLYQLIACETLQDVSGVAMGEAYKLPFVMASNASSPYVFTVNTVDDTDGDGLCSPTQCTLREAIDAANTNVGLDTIAFEISGNTTIQPLTRLPEITDPVIIDGWTQPGFSGAPLIELDGSQLNEVQNTSPIHHGLEISAGNSTVRGLVINNFNGTGLYFHTNGNNTIEGNYIGTNTAGDARRSNYIGLHIESVNDNQIGGTTAQSRNLISGNVHYGAIIAGNNQVIEGNFIGTNIAGTASLTRVASYEGRGISITGDNIRVGGTTNTTPTIGCAGACNLISGNYLNNFSTTDVSNITIQGNIIGYDITGLVVVPYTSNNTVQTISGTVLIGGTDPAMGNLFGSTLILNRYGVIQGNRIGVNLAGDIRSSIQLSVSQSTDEPFTITNNVISRLNVFNATALVENNYLSASPEGDSLRTMTASLFNQGQVQLRNNIIGGPIEFSGGSGIVENNWIGIMPDNTPLSMVVGLTFRSVSTEPLWTVRNNVITNVTGNYAIYVEGIGTNSQTVDISQNSIFNNRWPGIALNRFRYCWNCLGSPASGALLPNDPFDDDIGTNGVQNYPEISGASTDGNTLTLTGLLHSRPSETYRVEFFANEVCHEYGYGEGERYIGTINVTTNSAGDAPIYTLLDEAVETGDYITATATGVEGTSSFSACYEVNDQPILTSPDNLTATVVSPVQVNLAWSDAGTAETGYQIERSANGITNWERIGTATANSTTFNDTSALCGTSYYRVRASYGALSSSFITARTDTETQPCNQLEFTVASQSATAITLQWQNIATNYVVETSLDGETNWQILTETILTNYTHTNLACESTQYYRLSATGGDVEPETTLTALLSVNVDTLCTPTNLTTTDATTTTISLTWEDQSSNENGYVVERSRDGITWEQRAIVDSTTYTDTDLICVYEYRYRVRAVNTASLRYSAYSTVLVTSPVICDITDLTVEIVTENTTVLVNELVTYTMTIRNNGPTAVNNAVVTLDLPEQLSVESISHVCPNGVCELGALAVNTSVEIIITGRLTIEGTFTFTTAIDSEVVDVTGNNIAILTIEAIVPSITQLSPIGTITTPYGDPTFTWLDSGASQFEFYLNSMSSPAFVVHEVISDTSCSYTTCEIDVTSLNETYRMTNGSYQWYVREPDGVWVGPMTFTLNAPPPGLVTLETTTDLDNLAPTLNWSLANEAVNATYFNLYLTTTSGTLVFDQWFSRVETCDDANGTVCSVQSPITLVNNTGYSLYVRSYGPGGYSVGGPLNNGYQGAETFTVNAPIPTQIAPTGTVDIPGGNPVYTWNDLENAEYYYLYVANSAGTQVINEVVSDVGYCDGVTCQLDATTLREAYHLSNDTYTWYIRAWRNNQATPWSTGVTFTLNSSLPGLVTQVAPLQDGVEPDYDITFQWQEVENASGYNLYLVNPNGGNSGILPGYIGEQVSCLNGMCEWTYTLTEVPGAWTWYVSAFNAAGTGTWSSALTFTAPGAIPDVVIGVAPSINQALTDSLISFEWIHNIEASRYELYLAGPNAYVHYQSYEVSTDVICDTNCSLVLPAPLAGSYTWYVRAGSEAGWSDWNSGIAFTVTDTVPQIVTKIAPLQNTVFTEVNVDFSWQHDAEATVYEVYITGPNSYAHHQTYGVGNGATCTTDCVLNLALPENGTYTWYVRAGNAGGFSLWNASEPADYGGVTFTVTQVLPGVIQKSLPASIFPLSNLDVEFMWVADEQATLYDMYITGPNSYVHHQVYSSGTELNCTDLCSLDLQLPANGTYTWYVRGGNDGGWGPWSAGEAADGYGGRSFTVEMPLPGVSVKSSPAQNATLSDIHVEFLWHLSDLARYYELYVVGPNGYTRQETYSIFDDDIVCSIPGCRVMLTLPANGAYTWYVRGGNAAGWGLWSAGEAADGYGASIFTVNMPVPVATSLIRPADEALIYQTNRPTFVWNTLNTATYYRLLVVNGMGTAVYDQWHEATNLCTDGTCSFSLPQPIAFGAYTWQIQTYNVAGMGALSETRNFLSLSFNIQPLMVQVEGAQITRNGVWTLQTDLSAMGQSYLQSSNAGTDTLTMTFTGTQVDVIYVVGAQYGTFVVEIDGEPLRGINANAAQTIYGQVASFTGLSDGEHTLRIIPLGGAPVAIDALVVNGQVLATAPVEQETPVVIPLPATESAPAITPTLQPEETETATMAPVLPTMTQTPFPTATERPPTNDADQPEVTAEP